LPSNTFNINSFLSEIGKNGVLQTNKFAIDIGDGAAGSISDMISLRAESVNLPGISLDAPSTRRYGISPVQKMPMNIGAFPDVTISFIDDKQTSIWKAMYNWMNTIYQFTVPDNKPMYALEYKDNYTKDILIHVYDNAGEERTTIRLKEAFPMSLADVSLSWSQNDNLWKTNVSFAYTEWQEEGVAANITNNITIQANPFSSGNNNVQPMVEAVKDEIVKLADAFAERATAAADAFAERATAARNSAVNAIGNIPPGVTSGG